VKLKAQFFIFMSLVLLLFVSAVWIYADRLQERINEKWGERFVKKQVIFDKNRTLLPIMREVALAKKMAEDPEILQMARNENDPVSVQKGIDALEYYRLKFADRSYFAAFAKSRHYYFNDYSNQYTGKQLGYTLSPSDKNDQWFFKALMVNEAYQINVNKDTIMGTTKVWINFLLRDGNQTLGIVGTGLDLGQFLKESVGIEQDGVRNLFINREMAIQLERDTNLIDYASIAKKKGEHRTLGVLLHREEDVKAIQNVMNEIGTLANADQIRTLWIDFEGKKQLLGIAYLHELNWFSLTLIDSQELSLVNSLYSVPILIVLLSVFFLAIGFVLNQLFLNPLNRLKAVIVSTEKDEYRINPPIVGKGEIAELSQAFRQMVALVRENNAVMEEKIRLRTHEVEQSEQKLNTILESVDAYIYIKDAHYRYVYVNKQVREFFGKEARAIIGKEDDEFFDNTTVSHIRINDRKVIEEGLKVVEEEVNTSSDGKIVRAFLSTKLPLLDDEGKVYALCGISTDITERKKAEEIIRNMAFYDTLTGLPNRRMLDDRLSVLMANGKRSGKYGALMFLDMDHFKELNDTWGHKAGDALLIAAAERMLSCVRESDTVARLGGDEFIVAMGELDADEDVSKELALKLARKILESVNRPYAICIDEGSMETIEYRCSVSIGVTLFGKEDHESEKVLQRADHAMYEAKEEGRNGVVFRT